MKKTSPTLLILCCLGFLTLTACGPGEPATAPAPDLATALIGTWETVEVETTSPTYEGQDTTVSLLITEGDWSRKFGTRPARTQYMADGKLKRTFHDLSGQVIDVTHGLWKPVGTDSLLVIEPSNVLRYAYTLDGSLLTLTGTIDWDFDGEQDDAYRGVLRLVARTSE